MKLQIRVDENGIISDVKFKTFGCGSAIASSSYMTERVKGLSLEEAGKIKNTEIAKELALPPVKLHCSSASPLAFVIPCCALADFTCAFSVLAEDAIRSAIRDYHSKRSKLLETRMSMAGLRVSRTPLSACLPSLAPSAGAACPSLGMAADESAFSYRPDFQNRARMSLAFVATTRRSIGRPMRFA